MPCLGDLLGSFLFPKFCNSGGLGMLCAVHNDNSYHGREGLKLSRMSLDPLGWGSETVKAEWP